MVTYRFFTMGTSGEMLSRSCADHVTDAQARFHAALRLKPGQRVEVWRGAICIWEMSSQQLTKAWFPETDIQQSAVAPLAMRFMPSHPREKENHQ
jgi:hypothetical protein